MYTVGATKDCRRRRRRRRRIAVLDHQTPNDPSIYYNLAVRESWRRRGVATLLIQASERLVRDEYQGTHLCLNVRRSTPTAVALYQKLGYVIFQPPPASYMAERPDPLQRTRREDDSIWWMGKQLVQLQEENEKKETNDALAIEQLKLNLSTFKTIEHEANRAVVLTKTEPIADSYR